MIQSIIKSVTILVLMVWSAFSYAQQQTSMSDKSTYVDNELIIWLERLQPQWKCRRQLPRHPCFGHHRGGRQQRQGRLWCELECESHAH